MIHYCENCKKEIKGRGVKFCNNKCQNLKKTKKILETWLKEQNGLPSPVVRWLKEKTDYKCSKCGWGERNKTTNKIPIEIDHIDGDSKNNKLENLRVLCPNCHSLTSTYKGANKKSTREYRKKYYKNIKYLKDKEKKDYLNNIKEKLISSNIDFSKRGWCQKASNIIEISPQKVRNWMKKNLADIESLSYKRK